MLNLKVDEYLGETSDGDVDGITRTLGSLALDTKPDANESHTPTPVNLLSDLRIGLCSHPVVLIQLGKLREALIALRKEDEEAEQILLASVKVGIRSHHNETYLPSLRTLLEQPTYPPVIHGWYALYLLFTLEDFSEFFAFITSHAVEEYYIRLAQVLMNGDYIGFTRLVETGSRYDRALIADTEADKRMKRRLVEVIGKCYYRVEVEWYNRLGANAPDRWERDGDMYIIRRRRQKPENAPS